MPSTPRNDIEVQTVAYLLSQNYSQSAICDSLHLPQPTVSRYIKRARELGWLKTIHEFELDDEEQLEKIKARITPQQLWEALNELSGIYTKNGIGLRVFPSPKPRIENANWEFQRDNLGRAAAIYIREMLKLSRVCGVSWGWTVNSIVRGLSELPRTAVRLPESVQFVPLCGEPLGSVVTQYSSSYLAARFNEILNGQREFSYSLASVPALIPEDFSEDEASVVYKLLQHVDTYCEVFGGGLDEDEKKKPLIDNVDSIITGVGSREYSLGFWHDNLIKAAGIKRDDLHETVLGDICGTLIPHPNLTETQKNMIVSINERWTGIKQTHLERCVKKARMAPATNPGVIVVALGRRKAAIIYESIRLGLINHIVIDQRLADELERLIKASRESGDWPNLPKLEH